MRGFLWSLPSWPITGGPWSGTDPIVGRVDVEDERLGGLGVRVEADLLVALPFGDIGAGKLKAVEGAPRSEP